MKLGTLHYRKEEGDVMLAAEFVLEPDVVQLDILQDWIALLQAEYLRQHDIVFASPVATSSKAN